jgi:hypothetical protein
MAVRRSFVILVTDLITFGSSEFFSFSKEQNITMGYLLFAFDFRVALVTTSPGGLDDINL